MKTLTLAPVKPMLDGFMVADTLDLETFAPVVIMGANIPMSARIIICADKQVQQRIIQSSYQMMHPVLDGVLFELGSNVIWQDFDFTNDKVKDEQRMYLRQPQVWQPVTIRSATGKLPVVIEARCGNPKHKAHIVINLHVQG
jgi:hypothetical protein